MKNIKSAILENRIRSFIASIDKNIESIKLQEVQSENIFSSYRKTNGKIEILDKSFFFISLSSLLVLERFTLIDG